jgi:hypothetical protein
MIKKIRAFLKFLSCPRNMQMFGKKIHHYPTFLALRKNLDSQKVWAFWNFYAA